jgi:hypothetical protein
VTAQLHKRWSQFRIAGSNSIDYNHDLCTIKGSLAVAKKKNLKKEVVGTNENVHIGRKIINGEKI